MVFSSIFFLFTFLPLSLLLYWMSPAKIKNFTLLAVSLFFYAWGEPVYVLLMIASILTNFVFGIFIESELIKEKRAVRRALFISAVVFNILILGFFKYYGFLAENINALFNADIAYSELPLPIGISFYTFQVLSYVIDVYLGKVRLQRNPVSFALYVTMFPQLIAGPIVRYSDIESQLEQRNVSAAKFGEGAQRFIQGLGKKVLIANSMGALWDITQAMDMTGISVFSAWLGIIAYTFQIYFDFSGYSDMAIGLGKMFGFEFMENFDHPYISRSVTEFWRRWHISLGTWFREYVYIPLGGNRCSRIRQIRNIMAVWMLTGLWHGASWNFVVWGIYYGCLLLIEKMFLKKLIDNAPAIISHVYCMLAVIIGWVLFASRDIESAAAYLGVMSGASGNVLVDNAFIYYLKSNAVMLVISLLFSTGIFREIFEPEEISDKIRTRVSHSAAVILHAFILFMSTAYLVTETYNPFLYFRF
ncbi:MAG: MBOAT family protein [Proteocatella sp.]|nr:MBOAT family protein [Proteocatella sp.]MBP9658573.1 MBOAT family protein [Proteocatella sp.]